MSELSQIIFSILSLLLLPIIWILFFSWLMNRFFPNNKWLKRGLKRAARLVLIEPFKKFYAAIRWLTVKLFTARPDYRLQQIHLENYPVTPLAFYNAVEEILRQRQIIGVEISRIVRREWHLLSARRIYLLIRFRDAVCFIGATPLGTSFLVSWRYTAQPGKLLLILFQVPFAGTIAEKLLKPPTFYRADIYHAFEQVIRSTVLETTNLLTAQEGVRPLTENEQRPLLREFYG
jgi:hypothetical protein